MHFAQLQFMHIKNNSFKLHRWVVLTNRNSLGKTATYAPENTIVMFLYPEIFLARQEVTLSDGSRISATSFLPCFSVIFVRHDSCGILCHFPACMPRGE